MKLTKTKANFLFTLILVFLTMSVQAEGNVLLINVSILVSFFCLNKISLLETIRLVLHLSYIIFCTLHDSFTSSFSFS